MKCPRCNDNELREPRERNALSRRDNQTLICEACGIEEAMVDAGFATRIQLVRDQRFITHLRLSDVEND